MFFSITSEKLILLCVALVTFCETEYFPPSNKTPHTSPHKTFKVKFQDILGLPFLLSDFIACVQISTFVATIIPS